MNWPVIIEIPRATPSNNQVVRAYRNGHAKKRLRELWELELACALKDKRGPMKRYVEKNRPRMRLTVLCRRKRLLDPDNLRGGLKPILDAAKNIGLIVDDRVEFLDHPDPVQEKCGRMRPVTRIEISPVEVLE